MPALSVETKLNLFKYSHQGLYGDLDQQMSSPEDIYNQEIMGQWKDLKGMSKDEAMSRFIDIAIYVFMQDPQTYSLVEHP